LLLYALEQFADCLHHAAAVHQTSASCPEAPHLPWLLLDEHHTTPDRELQELLDGRLSSSSRGSAGRATGRRTSSSSGKQGSSVQRRIIEQV
jgi:hypothetical protein